MLILFSNATIYDKWKCNCSAGRVGCGADDRDAGDTGVWATATIQEREREIQNSKWY